MLALIGLSAVLALAGGSVQPATAAPTQTPPVAPGELIVGFERSASQAQQNAAVLQAGATRSASYPQIRAVLVRVPAKLTGVDQAPARPAAGSLRRAEPRRQDGRDDARRRVVLPALGAA